MAPFSRNLSAIHWQTKPMVTCHFLYYLVCIAKIYSNLPAMWLTYCRGEHSQARMTAMLSALSADPAPISSSSHFYPAALNQREREEKKKKRGVILRMEMATLKEALENGPSPSVVSLETGASKELCASTAKDTNDPMTLGKGCWSVNLALDDPSYVGQNE